MTAIPPAISPHTGIFFPFFFRDLGPVFTVVPDGIGFLAEEGFGDPVNGACHGGRCFFFYFDLSAAIGAEFYLFKLINLQGSSAILTFHNNVSSAFMQSSF